MRKQQKKKKTNTKRKNVTNDHSRNRNNKNVDADVDVDVHVHDTKTTKVPSFQVGDHVMLHGLKSSKYNGKIGKVVSLPKSTDVEEKRYGIRLLTTDVEESAVATATPPIAICQRNLKEINKSSASLSPKKVEQNDTEATVTSKLFQVGDRVLLHGLSTTKYNGRTGKVVSLPEPDDVEHRHGILVDGIKNASPLAIRAQNLQNQSSSSSSRNETKFKVGDRVALQGLKTLKYNGKSGKVVSLPKLDDVERRYGVLLDYVGGSAIAIREENLQATGRQDATLMSTEEQRQVRDDNENNLRPSENSMDVDQLGMMRMMMNMLAPSEEDQIRLYGRKIDPMPNFFEELVAADRKGGGIPEGVDKSWARNHVRESFEHSNSLPHVWEMVYRDANYNPFSDYGNIFMRLGTNVTEKVTWYMQCIQQGKAAGTIYRDRKVNPYCATLRHSYSNQVYRKEMLHFGKTHVAVGFVDLGILFAAELVETPSDMLYAAAVSSTARRHIKPLRFLGIDSSAYAVAKTLVIWKMIQQTPSVQKPMKTKKGDGSAADKVADANETLEQKRQRRRHVRSIVQVWFSSTWSQHTESAVMAALTSLCNENDGQAKSVKRLLQYWRAGSPMTLRRARQEWEQTTTNNHSYIGHMARKCDRIALAKYILSGDFGFSTCDDEYQYDDDDDDDENLNDEEYDKNKHDGKKIMMEEEEEKAYYGNRIMLDCPDGTPPLAKDETIFSALGWIQFMGKKHYEKKVHCRKTTAKGDTRSETATTMANKKKPKKNKEPTATSSTTTILESAERYALAGVTKIVDWSSSGHVTVDLVCADIQDVIDEIVVPARPWTMSWSNICDYMDHTDFHRIARACSIHGDTIHFGYSMNWRMDMYGVNIIDYYGAHHADFRSRLIDIANEGSKRTYKIAGCLDYLRWPPPTHPMNTTSYYGLEMQHYLKWCNYFFSDIGTSQGRLPCNVGNFEHVVGSPLSPTGGSTVAFSWTYDDTINFDGSYSKRQIQERRYERNDKEREVREREREATKGLSKTITTEKYQTQEPKKVRNNNTTRRNSQEMVLNKSGFGGNDNNGSAVIPWHWPDSLTNQNRKIEKLRLTQSIFSSYKSALQKVAHVVHFKSDLSSLSHTVDRVTTCGSMGKWTAVRDKADVDLIIYIDTSGRGLSPEDFASKIQDCIDKIENAIDKQYPEAKSKSKSDKGGLSYEINDLHIDIHVGMTNLLPKDFLLISDRKVREFLSASVSHLNKRLIQGQSHLYHDMVRVVKDWRDSFEWEVRCKPKSYMLEVIMLEVFKDLGFCSKNTLKTGPQFPHYYARWARQKILYNFFDMIGRVDAYNPQMNYDKDNLPSLFVCSSPHFTVDDLPLDEPQPIFERHAKRKATAIVMDPVNPTNNLWLTMNNATIIKLVHRARQTATQLSSAVDADNS